MNVYFEETNILRYSYTDPGGIQKDMCVKLNEIILECLRRKNVYRMNMYVDKVYPISSKCLRLTLSLKKKYIFIDKNCAAFHQSILLQSKSIVIGALKDAC